MALSQQEKGQRFRALHARAGAFVIPNPWDLGSARVLAGLGFEALATTSSGFALSRGRRDGGMSRDEVLAHCRMLAEATDLPVSADLENCFGDDPKTVADTIRRGAEAGLAGASVEDFSGDPRRPIYNLSHAVERVAAAVEAVRALPFAFTLTARAENYLHGRADLDDTLRRLEAFAKAGADVLYAPGLPDLAALRRLCAAVGKPVNVLAGRPAGSVTEYAEAGAKRISLGGLLARTAFGALLNAAREMKQQGTFSFADKAASMAAIAEFMAENR